MTQTPEEKKIARLEKELAAERARAEGLEKRAQREEQAGREAGDRIEKLLRELGDAKAECAGKDTEIRVLRELAYRLLPSDAGEHGISFGQDLPQAKG